MQARRYRRSTHRRCVLQTTFVPQGIETTLDLQLAAGTDVAIEGLAVVTYLLDDLYRPVLRQFQILAKLTFGTEQTGYVGVLVVLAVSSTLAEVTPSSSALTMANSDQRTMSNHSSSPWRTTGPRGSLEMTSGSTT